MKTFISKYLSSSYDLLFSVMLSIFMYLLFQSPSIIWMLFTLFSLLAIIHKPQYIFLGLIIFIVALVISQYTNPRHNYKPTGIRKDALDYFMTGPEMYSKYAPLMFLGIKNNESKEIYDIALRINVVHLFVISGFHISLFFKMIKKILITIRVKENYAEFIALIPIIVYLFFLGFPISATRAMFLVIFSTINRNIFKKRFNNIELLSFTMCLMFLINPHNVTSYSYILTYLATYVIMIVNDYKFKRKGAKTLTINLLAYFSTLPIILSMNGYISILGMLFGFLLTPLFIFMYTVTMFLFPFKELLNYLYIGFDFVLRSVDSINIMIDFPWVTKEISKYIYLSEYGILIIYRIWNLYMVKKSSLLTTRSKKSSQVQ